MATVSATPSFSFCTVCRVNTPTNTFLPSTNGIFSCSLPVRRGAVALQKSDCICYPRFSVLNNSRVLNLKKIRSLAEGISVVPDPADDEGAWAAVEPAVSVPVSPSDVLTMFFQAEGTMSSSAVPMVTRALEAAEGISDLRIENFEGIAVVELKKQTTVQATGVASDLVQLLQSSGFKLQTLNLSFEDDETN